MEKRILIIDDEYAVFDLIKEVIGATYIVNWAEDCTQAKAYLTVHNPDLVFLDLNLHDIEGERLCAEIVSEKRLLHDVPIVILSATPEKRMQKVMCDIPNIRKYIAKPWDIEEITATITTLIA